MVSRLLSRSCPRFARAAIALAIVLTAFVSFSGGAVEPTIAHGVADQEQTTYAGGYGGFGNPFTTIWGQTFTPTVDNIVAFETGFQAAGPVTIVIRQWPSGPDVATLTNVTLAGTFDHIDIPNNGVSLTPGTKYGILVTAGGEISGVVTFTDSYAGGAAVAGNAESSGDFWFRTFYNPNFVTDRDYDGIFIPNDNCPTVANQDQLDTDDDDSGNACDTDDDGDSVLDVNDNCPLVANGGQLDTDDDDLGNACDFDDDNDGYSDVTEVAAGSNPLLASSVPAQTEDVVDQSFVGFTHGPCSYSGQTFTTGAGVTNVAAFDLWFAFGSGGGAVFSLVEYPNTSTVLATSGAATPDGNGLYHFVLSAPVPVSPETKYLVRQTSGDSVCFQAVLTAFGEVGYTRGSIWAGDEDGSWDASIRTYQRVALTVVDTDSDGVGDLTDNCPSVANAGQLNSDSDSLGDACDLDDDNDSYSDTDEVAAGSNPLNAASTPEVCDGADNDLDSQTDEGFLDSDNDGQKDCVDNDKDNDGIADDIDTQPLVPDVSFSDVPLGGATAGQIISVPNGMAVTISEEANPEGVRIVVTGGTLLQRVRIQLTGKGSNFLYRAGTYILTDPEEIVTVTTLVGGPAEIELPVGNPPTVVTVPAGATARITETTENGVSTGATVEAVAGTIRVNNQPVTPGQPPINLQIPEACLFLQPFAKVITGSSGNDLLFGTPGRDLIFGLGGNDKILSGDGDDCIVAGDGRDTVFAGKGADVIMGGGGNDVLYGVSGGDTIFGDEGDDAVSGGEGDDVVQGGAGRDSLNGDAGNDQLYGGLNDIGANDVSNGGPGQDVCRTGLELLCELD